MNGNIRKIRDCNLSVSSPGYSFDFFREYDGNARSIREFRRSREHGYKMLLKGKKNIYYCGNDYVVC